MNRAWLFPLLLAGLAAFAVAMVGGTMTDLGPWYQSLRQPSWAPPNWLYGVAWTIIFALVALAIVSAWRAAASNRDCELILGLFALNGFLNIMWSLLFFRLQRPDWAVIELVALWVSIVILMIVCGRHSRLAALLLVPYLVWVSFAGVLNWQIVQLNGPFG